MILKALVVCALIARISKASELKDWLTSIQNFDQKCVPDESWEAIGSPLLQVTNCDDPNSKWNYKYKSSIGPHKIRQKFTGPSTLTFSDTELDHGNFRHGIKSGKCIKFDDYENIAEIKGTFNSKEELEGPVIVTFRDGTILDGYLKESLFIGTKRYFSKDIKLQNLTDIDTGIVTWECSRPDVALVKPLNTDELIAILKPESEPLVCSKLLKGKIYQCHEVLKSAEKPRFEGCKIHWKNPVQNSFEAVQVHSTTFQSRKSNEKFNSCLATDSWNSENIREKITNWRDGLLNFRSNQWYQRPSETPLDPKYPRIKIFLSLFANRIGLHSTSFYIRSNDGRSLLKGFMINGLISEDVPSEVALLDDWKLPISIYINKPSEVHLLVGEDQISLFVVTGQLYLGQLHGLVVMEGVVSNSPEGLCSDIAFEGLGLAAQFRHGIPFGKVWKQLLGGSWIHGEVDENGDLTGDKISYIYPDLENSLIGKFVKGIMVEAQATKVVGERCNQFGIKELVFDEPSGPFYHYQPPTNETFGDQPLLEDSLDSHYMELGQSIDMPAAGQGAFAKVPIRNGTVFSLYGGMIFNRNDSIRSDIELNIFERKNKWIGKHPLAISSWKYRQSLFKCQRSIHIPAEFEPTSKYRATLGHKLNHSFKPNSKYEMIDTPRFGIIQGLRALRDISPGEELLASYAYKFEQSPQWYKDLLINFMRENPEEVEKLEGVHGGRSPEKLIELNDLYLENSENDLSFLENYRHTEL